MNNQPDSSVTAEVVDSVAKQTSFFIDFWQNIDWNKLLSAGISKVIQIFIFFLIFFCKKFFDKYFSI